MCQFATGRFIYILILKVGGVVLFVVAVVGGECGVCEAPLVFRKESEIPKQHGRVDVRCGKASL